MTPEEILERLDVEHIDSMAHQAALALEGCGAVRVELTPGDATRYEIIIYGLPLITADGSRHWGGDYVVTLVNCDGRSYYWNGGHLNVGYVQEKWVDRLWTAVVLTAFLNAVDCHLED